MVAYHCHVAELRGWTRRPNVPERHVRRCDAGKRYGYQCHPLTPSCQVSAKPARIRPPRNSPRVHLYQLEHYLTQQGKNQTELAELLGFERQQVTASKRRGFVVTDAQRTAAWLGVPLDVLTARSVAAADDGPTVRAILSRPHIAHLSASARDQVMRIVDDAVREAVTETVALLSSRTIPLPEPVPAKKPTILRAVERREADRSAVPRVPAKRAR